MKRALVATAAGALLAGCGVIGPGQGDLERAVQAFYAGGAPEGAADLRGAHVADFDGCQPLGGLYRCPVQFSTSAGDVATLVWIERTPAGGWHVRNIVLNERSRP